jgi:hypothetical protein
MNVHSYGSLFFKERDGTTKRGEGNLEELAVVLDDGSPRSLTGVVVTCLHLWRMRFDEKGVSVNY